MSNRPTPTAKRKLQGNPSGRPFNEREPELPPASGAPPDELADDAVALTEWNRLLPLLQRARAVTEGDRGSLLALCQQWARYLDANKRIAGQMVVRSPSGYPMPNPYIAISNRALHNCLKLWIELGLTPSARSKVTTADGLPPLPDDAFAEFDDPPSRRPSH